MSSPSLLLQLVATGLEASQRAGVVIRSILADGALKEVQKGIDDPQTEADRQAQVVLVSSFKSQWPMLKVIAEEGTLGHTGFYTQDTSTNLDSKILSKPCPDKLKDIKLDEVVVWIDPLDGTKEFTQGVLSAVTVLVGIAVNGNAIAGVVHQPFYKQIENTYQGRSLWGVVGLGAYGYTHTTRASDGMVISTTRSHPSKELEEAVAELQAANVIKVGGAGNKVIQLLEGFSDAYVFPTPGTKKWDTCAPEAILRAAGGLMTDREGQKFNYDDTSDVNILNSKGLLATLDPSVHSYCLDKLRIVYNTQTQGVQSKDL
eukprot:CFRG3459T1